MAEKEEARDEDTQKENEPVSKKEETEPKLKPRYIKESSNYEVKKYSK